MKKVIKYAIFFLISYLNFLCRWLVQLCAVMAGHLCHYKKSFYDATKQKHKNKMNTWNNKESTWMYKYESSQVGNYHCKPFYIVWSTLSRYHFKKGPQCIKHLKFSFAKQDMNINWSYFATIWIKSNTDWLIDVYGFTLHRQQFLAI